MKITLRLGRLECSFATASELRNALLSSFIDTDYTGGPLVLVAPDDARPAWAWVVELIRQRTDWRLALGLALQHAAHDGGDLARTALADLLANFRESIAELEWTSPLAQRWPDARATRANAGFGGGGPNPRLEDIATEEKALLSAVSADPTLFLDDYGPSGAPVTARIVDAVSLQPPLEVTAVAGRAPGGKGPWSWINGELIFRSWLPAALVPAMTTAVADGGASLYAFLDWVSEECDLWRFVDLLEKWTSAPPSWWSDPVAQIPPGWPDPIRTSAWTGVATLGDVVAAALARARAQAGTPALVDLKPRP